MRVIYLDFDGTIRINGKFSKAAIKNLQKILKEVPDAQIVVSSSWRHRGLKFVRDALVDLGIDKARIERITGLEHENDRGHHIERDVSDNKIALFVILDDKDDMDEVKDHLVQTNPTVGLTSKDAEKAIKLLR